MGRVLGVSPVLILRGVDSRRKMMRPLTPSVARVRFMLPTVALICAPTSARDIFRWTSPVDGNFNDAVRWTLVSGAGPPPPGGSDTARFNQSGGYDVRFLTTSSSAVVEITAGSVRWTGPVASVGNYFVTGGDADMLVSGGATLDIGFGASSRLNLLVGDDLIVASGSQLRIHNGSTVDCDDLWIGSIGNGTVTVNGTSSLDDIGHDPQDIARGLLEFSGTAEGTIRGTTSIGVTAVAGAPAMIHLEHQLTTLLTDSLVVGGGADPASSGEIELHGELTMRNGTTLTVGGAAGTGTGLVHTPGPTAGMLVTGGQTFVNPTGTLTGNIQFADDVTVDGGVLSVGAENFAPGSDVTVTNDGQYDRDGGLDLSDSVSVMLTTGADLNATHVRVGLIPDGDATLTLDGAGTTGTQFDLGGPQAILTIGNAIGGPSLLQISNGASWHTSVYQATVGPSGTLETLTGGMFNLHGNLLVDAGAALLQGGILTIDEGLDVTVEQSGQIMFPPAFDITLDGTEIWQALSAGTLDLPGNMTLGPAGTFRVDGGSASLGSLTMSGGTLDFPAGSLTIGSDFRLDGDLTLEPGASMTVNGTTTLFGPDVLTVNGGAYNGSALELFPGSSFDFDSGSADVSGSVLALGGTVINLWGGDTIMGDVSRPDGFYCNGTIDVYDNTLTILDNNDAVFDSAAFVGIGVGSTNGMIIAANGLTLDFGANMRGVGVINTPDDPTRPLINNGHIAAFGFLTPIIELTGYVKGVGTFSGVNFTGTFSPGFSPAAINLGSAMYTGSLSIEIGGLNPGGDHDQLNHVLGDRTATLGGELRIELIDGYVPSSGDSFTIMTAASVDGQFATIEAPLNLRVEYLPDRVIVHAVCAADLNADDVVNVLDLLLMLAAWGSNPGHPADLNGDDLVNVLDVLLMLTEWGACA